MKRSARATSASAGSLRVGDRKLDDGLAERRREARGLRRRGYFLLEVVHVGERRGARLESSRARRAACGRARTPERTVLASAGKMYLFQPFLQGKSSREPAEEHHGA
jgi:hypothetical protein